MEPNYFTLLQPTFTQGLLLGQFSILFLLYLILKYLFLSSEPSSSSYYPRKDSDALLRNLTTASNGLERGKIDSKESPETTEWFNSLLQQVVELYRSKMRNDLPGLEGDEVARQRIEDLVNAVRPVDFLDYVKIHSVDLGVSAPRLSNARRMLSGHRSEIEFDINYVDTVSISLSTSYLFHFPKPSFGRLPVSLTISLAVFKSSIKLIPPSPTSSVPMLAISITPDFTLDLTTTSLIGSRAKLADVPKLHELIQHQVRRLLSARGAWEVVLPGLGIDLESACTP